LKPDGADLDLRASFINQNQARDAVKMALGVRDELQRELERDLQRSRNRPDEVIANKLLEALLEGFKSVKLETTEGLVTGTARIPTGPAIELVEKDGGAFVKSLAERRKAQNNLRMIALAMHNYASAYGRLPSAAICDNNGKPLLSWRVAILPFIEEDVLYRQFRLNEPWDSEHNKKLIERLPKTYQLPGDTAKHDLPSTYYRVFVGNDAMFNWTRGRSFAEITGGLSNTIMVVEAADAVPWTKPDELEYDPKKPPKLGYHIGDACNVALGDGSVRSLRKGLKEEILHSLIQANRRKLPIE